MTDMQFHHTVAYCYSPIFILDPIYIRTVTNEQIVAYFCRAVQGLYSPWQKSLPFGRVV